MYCIITLDNWGRYWGRSFCLGRYWGRSFCLENYAEKNILNYTILLSILNQLDINQTLYEKNIENYSEGQKRKILIASSLITPANIYILDEPLNYIDVLSRMQIETLISTFKPTMLIVEHDVTFMNNLANKIISF